MAKRALKQVCALLGKCKPPVDEQNRERITYGLFSTIFRTACIALCGQGRYVSGKGGVVSASCEVYPQEHKLHGILSPKCSVAKIEVDHGRVSGGDHRPTP